MYKEKIQGHDYPLKYVPNLHVPYSEHSIHHFFPKYSEGFLKYLICQPAKGLELSSFSNCT